LAKEPCFGSTLFVALNELGTWWSSFWRCLIDGGRRPVERASGSSIYIWRKEKEENHSVRFGVVTITITMHLEDTKVDEALSLLNTG
jgi:hypothetical protein